MPRGGRHTRPDSIPDGFLAQFLALFAWQRLVKETGRPGKDARGAGWLPGPGNARSAPHPDAAPA